jgi:hypothetical protein
VVSNKSSSQALAHAAIEECAVSAIERVLKGIVAPAAGVVPGPGDSPEASIYYYASGALLNMNDALAVASAHKESKKPRSSMRELSKSTGTMRSLTGWRKLRSIGALQISEGSAAAVEWRRALHAALDAKRREQEAPPAVPEEEEQDVADDEPAATPSDHPELLYTPDFLTPRSEDDADAVADSSAARRALLRRESSRILLSPRGLLPGSIDGYALDIEYDSDFEEPDADDDEAERSLELQELMAATKDELGAVIKAPVLTDALLEKPPFRFLHDVVSAVHS